MVQVNCRVKKLEKKDNVLYLTEIEIGAYKINGTFATQQEGEAFANGFIAALKLIEHVNSKEGHTDDTDASAPEDEVIFAN